MAPSGKGLPLPGTPSLKAAIATGFPRITAYTPPFSLIATTGQSSYPLNSENASPPGTCTVYLSCAEIALPPKTASTTAMITISADAIFVMAHSCQPLKPQAYQLWLSRVSPHARDVRVGSKTDISIVRPMSALPPKADIGTQSC